MVKHTIACVAMATLALAGVARAEDAAQCGPYKAIADSLGRKFHETPVSVALLPGQGGSTNVAITFASPLGETWTLVVADSAGEKGCVIMSGTQWAGARRRPLPPDGQAS